MAYVVDANGNIKVDAIVSDAATLTGLAPSSNPGVASAILKTDASGYVQVAGLGIGAANLADNRITMANGGQIGQALGPLIEFDDTNNYLEIMSCNVGIGTTSPNFLVHADYADGVFGSRQVIKGSALAAGATWANAFACAAITNWIMNIWGSGVRHCLWTGILHYFDSANKGVTELLDTGYDASFTVTIANDGNVSIQNNGSNGQVDNVVVHLLRLM